MRLIALTCLCLAAFAPASFAQSGCDSLAASHAAANGIPVSLVKRVIMRESRCNPRAISRGNYGVMQIRLGTARGMGYTGSAAGLLDANTNMTYAVKYLAGAYKAAHGNESRAVSLYASGYYYEAKRQGWAGPRATRTASAARSSGLFSQSTPTRSARSRHQAAARFALFAQPQSQRTRRVAATAYYREAAPRRRTRLASAAFNPFAALFAPSRRWGHTRRAFAYRYRHRA